MSHPVTTFDPAEDAVLPEDGDLGAKGAEGEDKIVGVCSWCEKAECRVASCDEKNPGARDHLEHVHAYNTLTVKAYAFQDDEGNKSVVLAAQDECACGEWTGRGHVTADDLLKRLPKSAQQRVYKFLHDEADNANESATARGFQEIRLPLLVAAEFPSFS